jgi:predicted nucleic acid-binding protein
VRVAVMHDQLCCDERRENDANQQYRKPQERREQYEHGRNRAVRSGAAILGSIVQKPETDQICRDRNGNRQGRGLRSDLRGARHHVDFNSDIAESAARLRGKYGLKLPDALQVASALSINAAALVTHDRDFSSVRGLRILT